MKIEIFNFWRNKILCPVKCQYHAVKIVRLSLHSQSTLISTANVLGANAAFMCNLIAVCFYKPPKRNIIVSYFYCGIVLFLSRGFLYDCPLTHSTILVSACLRQDRAIENNRSWLS